MKFGLIAAGLGMVVIAGVAAAQPRPGARVEWESEHTSMDANGDGWITRAEASAAADRIFAELDSNSDGKLDREDRGHADRGVFQRRVEIHHGETRAEHHSTARRGEAREEGDKGVAIHIARPAHGMHGPMFGMMLHSSEEFDRNGDGALSREEFRAQHLRFFDAGDGNSDGRIRFQAPDIAILHDLHEPPEPPTPPEPPAPPAPPRR